MKAHPRQKNALRKKAKKGFRGYPLATVAPYGPDDKFASKVAVGILNEDDEVIVLERWFATDLDVRFDPSINQQIIKFIEAHHVRSVVLADKIMGCPHEEGIDYPKGEVCPKCPFWAHRDRWTGKLLH